MLLPIVRIHLHWQFPAQAGVLIAHRLEEAKQYGNTSQTQAATYDRNHVRYPYKSHAQWLKAGYGMVACIIMLIFNGVDSFLTTPFDVRTFIASYISVCLSHPFRKQLRIISQQSYKSIANRWVSRFPSSSCLSWVTRSADMVSGSHNGAQNDLRIFETVSKYQVTSERVGLSWLTLCSRSRMSRGLVSGSGFGPSEAWRYLASLFWEPWFVAFGVAQLCDDSQMFMMGLIIFVNVLGVSLAIFNGNDSTSHVLSTILLWALKFQFVHFVTS